MKKILVVALSVVIWFGILYLIGSFAAWELNPGRWSDLGRLMFIGIFVMGFVVCVGAYFEIKS